MAKHRLSRLCRAQIVLAATLMVVAPSAGAQAQGADPVAEAETLIASERFVEALAAAKTAVRSDESDYRAHYYVGMAYLGLRDFDAAENEAATALLLAPDHAKPAVEKLAAMAKSLRSGTANVADADAALAEGLIGKAARLYEGAWMTGRNAPDYALKAADLYATRLSQPAEAARLLRDVQRAMPASAPFDQADTRLKTLQPQLRAIAEARVKEAALLDWASAEPKLREAEVADPSYPALHITRARLAAASGSAALLESAIKALAQRNLADIDQLSQLPGIADYMKQPDFAQFIGDVVGQQQAATLAQMASPEIQIAILADMAKRGQLQLFVGRDPAGTGFQTHSRRMVTNVRSVGECSAVLTMGAVVSISSNLQASIKERVLDWRKTAPVQRDKDFLGLGPGLDGWAIHGFNVGNDAAVQQQAFTAVRNIQNGCQIAP